ncbi:endopeptidase La [Cytophagaceae bacterium DM2B3-1]|uniref:Lon protease n=1 Tax=Xanthocytophaga flava TaxID=3048013 RepID=A0ABT7CPD7_9BACT|nr:endopeptidase La [Xanthocytophaga flavus]MDJ1468738.1 endopeptidase La [Xanthocytophaga flavus]MDJ1495598.1 endopeptidase La [Xanthocytophaga flavus]
MRYNNNPYENLIVADIADDDAVEMIPLLSPDEDEDFEKFKVPEQLPILPVKNTVLFPGVVIPITVGRQKSIRLVKRAYKGTRVIGVVAQSNSNKEEPTYEDLYKTGTVAHIIKMLVLPDGNTTIIIQGKRRFEIVEPIQQDPYLTAKINLLPDNFPANTNKEVKAMVKSLKEAAGKILNLRPEIPREAQIAIENIESPSFLTNFLSSNLDAEVSDKQKILEVSEGMQRAELLLQFMQKDIQLLELKHEIQSKVHSDLDQQQRDYFLRQQIKVLQDELGYDSTEKEIEELRAKGLKKKWPAAVGKHFAKELDKITRINPQAAEYPVAMNYVELLIDLPWGEYTKDSFDLAKARKILDADHYGLDKIKDRIIEYLAVLKLTQSLRGPILCLYGPPGVGKTSLGRSIAKALGRHYVRMSLGGVHDEAEIRGHRKTYVGAMPGKVIQNIRKGKSDNPVFILDEIDKVGSDFRGDPSSALLEVLDPEQNSTFMDNYLEVEYDLSKVLFIATANSLETIQPALRDRMEIIELTGYTLEEKLQIAKKHLIPKQRKEHGLSTKDVTFDDKAIIKIIDDYTRESGVRSLERQIGTVMRKIAKSVAMEEVYEKKISSAFITKALGAEIFDKETYQDNSVAGVVTGLAWTQVGGEILFVESSLSRGRGRLTLSGQLGDVMKESASAALSYLRAHADTLKLDYRIFDQFDLHIHIPAGAVPKDGPSAGITMFTSLASVYTQRKVKDKLAMTGEITLRGRVLPVGGIKEKILAAKRAGIVEIIMSEKNRRDIEDINPKYIEGLKIQYVNTVDEVLQYALLPEKVANAVDLSVHDIKEKESANQNQNVLTV